MISATLRKLGMADCSGFRETQKFQLKMTG